MGLGLRVEWVKGSGICGLGVLGIRVVKIGSLRSLYQKANGN